VHAAQAAANAPTVGTYSGTPECIVLLVLADPHTLQMLSICLFLGAGDTIEGSSRSSGSGNDIESNTFSRHLLQNQWLWPRESAAISSSLAVVSALAAGPNGAADGIKTAARSLEIARLASNKAAKPFEYDRPAAPAQVPARQAAGAALGRRLMQQ
jgi:hypothetical protein